MLEPWRERVAQRLASSEGATLAAFRAYLNSKASSPAAQVGTNDTDSLQDTPDLFILLFELSQGHHPARLEPRWKQSRACFEECCCVAPVHIPSVALITV